MKRRSFLKSILAAVCAPLVVLKALVVEPKWMPGHAWNYLHELCQRTGNYTYRVYKDDKGEVISKDRMVSGLTGDSGPYELFVTVPIKRDEDIYKDWLAPRTECRINPFLPPEYVKTLKKLGY